MNARFTVGRVGLLLFLLAIPGLVLIYLQERSAENRLGPAMAIYSNLVWEFIGIAMTVLIIDRIYQSQETRQEKQTLLRQMRSQDDHIVFDTVERLRTQGWLADGTLSGQTLVGARFGSLNLSQADLSASNLREADLKAAQLYGADLEAADLNDANLQRGNLENARLTGTILAGVNLSAANLSGASASAEQLRQADRLAYATMPDGSRYDGSYRLRGDLRQARSLGFNPVDDVSMARFYDVTLETYQRGQRREVQRAAGSPHLSGK